MWHAMFLVFAAFGLRPCDLGIIYSNKTNSAFVSPLQNHLDPIFATECFELQDLPHSHSPDILLDLTNNDFLAYPLALHSSIHQVPVLSNQATFKKYPLTFQYQAPSLDHANALIALIQALHLDRLFILVENSAYYHQASHQLESALHHAFYKRFVVSSDVDTYTFQNLLGKTSRMYALSTYIVFGSEIFGKKVEDALLALNMLNEGTVVGYAGSACVGVQTSGSLCFFEEGTQTAATKAEYEAMLVTEFIENVVNTTGSCSIDAFQSTYPLHHKSSILGLYNVLEHSRKKVGDFNPSINQLVLTTNITYIGNTTDTVSASNRVIEFGINDSLINPDGEERLYNRYLLQGAYLAVEHLNNNTQTFPYHSFQLNSMSCGAFSYSYDFAKACILENRSRLGQAYIHSVGSSVGEGIYGILEELNHPLPQLGCCADKNELADKQQFEYFVRMVKSKSYKGGLVAWLSHIIGIQQCALLTSDLTGSTQIADAFVEVAESLGVTILNQNRTISHDYTLDQYEENKELFDEIINSQARFLVYIHTDVEPLQTFFDLGMRKGDLILLFPTLNDFEPEEENNYLEELVEYAITLEVASFVGDFGQAVYDELTQMLGQSPDPYHCLTYDSVKIVEEALSLMISLGEDYKDAKLLQHRIRTSRTTGCSGTISIESTSNDRSSEIYHIYQSYYDKKTGLIEYFTLGTFSPTSTVVVTYDSPILWPNGESTKPDDLRDDSSECPFDLDDVELNTAGFSVLVTLAVVVTLLCTLITLWMYRRWWNLKYPEIEVKRVMRFHDIVTLGYIGVEALQIASQGPRFHSFINILDKLTALVSFDATAFVSFSNDFYYILLYSVYTCCGLWVMLGLVYMYDLHLRYPRVWGLSRLYSLGEFFLPYIGTILFLPIIATLLNVFNCKEGTGDSIQDTFLAKDCQFSCWQGIHIGYVFFAIICLVVYHPIAVYTRPLWQEYSADILLFAQPRFLLLKTLVQTGFVLLNIIFYPGFYFVHAVLYVILLVVYVIFTWIWRPYNYRRANTLQRAALVALAWLALVSVFEFKLVELGDYYPFIFLLVGWGSCFLGFGICYLMQPALLVMSKDKPLEPFFLFQFSRKNPEEFGIRAKTIDFVDRSRIYVERTDHSTIPNRATIPVVT